MNQALNELARREKIFKIINLAFWGIWLIMPFSIAAFHGYWSDAIILAGLQGGCAGLSAQELSQSGKMAINLFFIIDTSFYLILFGLMHLLVHDCAKGRFLIDRTISIMGYISAHILVWVLVTIVSLNFMKYYLFSIGDIKNFTPDYSIDVVLVGASFFFIVLRYIFLHAMKLQEDAKLTV